MTSGTAEGVVDKPSEKRRKNWPMLMVVLAVAGGFLPISVVFFCGMLPTMAAYLTDRNPQKLAPLTVGGLNFCAVLPFAIAVVQRGYTVDAALTILAHPITWLVMLGGAALGWVILLCVPPAVASLVVGVTQLRVAGLEDRKKKLAEQWDPPLASVAGNATPARPV